MTAPLKPAAAAAPTAVASTVGILPARMKVLYITTLHRTGGWLAEAFASDSATQIVLEEVVGVTAGLARLRDEVFDAVLVSHEPGVLDALDLVEGLRGGGNDEPVILLGSEPAPQVDALAYEVGADDYCCVAETTVRGLLWKAARAIERYQLIRENRRLVQAERQRLQQEHHEAQRLLDQQRALIDDLETLDGGERTVLPLANVEEGSAQENCLAKTAAVGAEAAIELPETLVSHYDELLRTYVIMGVGNLSEEMAELTQLLAGWGISAQRAMQLHVHVLEELVNGLGNRSARHVMNRADLLVLEVMGHLADGYRRLYHERQNPASQLLLPGFQCQAAA